MDKNQTGLHTNVEQGALPRSSRHTSTLGSVLPPSLAGSAIPISDGRCADPPVPGMCGCDSDVGKWWWRKGNSQSLVVGWRIVGQSQAAGSTRGGLCEREIRDMNW